MGFFDNAQEIDADEVHRAIKEVFVEDEDVRAAFSLIRDQMVFTNLRIVFMDEQGLTGRKKSFLTIPYKSINRYSVETAGLFDMDADLKIWVKGRSQPIVQDLHQSIDTAKVSRLISRGVL